MGRENSPESISERERQLKETEAIFVLAAGHPGQRLSVDAKLASIGLLELIPKALNLKNIFFVGGRPEVQDQVSVSQEEADYFRRQLELEKQRLQKQGKPMPFDISVEALSQSNNTLDNLKELLEEIGRRKIHNFVIMSNQYHLQRVEEMMESLGLAEKPRAAEEFATGRSACHERLIQRREVSPSRLLDKAVEKMMIVMFKLDPEYKLIKKWRTFIRSRKAVTK